MQGPRLPAEPEQHQPIQLRGKTFSLDFTQPFVSYYVQYACHKPAAEITKDYYILRTSKKLPRVQVISCIIMHDEHASLLPYRRGNWFLRLCPRDYMRPLIMSYVMQCHFCPHIHTPIYNLE